MAKQITSTQQLIDIEEIRNGVIILKNGGLRRIILVSGINFDLKSEEEQGVISYAYQNFLNSLDFSVQFFIHSRKINIEAYLNKLNARMQEEKNELLKNQISEYREFIRSFVAQNPIMDKTFFVVVPFDPIVVPKAARGALNEIFGLLKKNQKKEDEEKNREQKIELGIVQLSQRVQQVLSGLNAIGLGAVALNSDEVIELFYNLYNPEEVERRELIIQ